MLFPERVSAASPRVIVVAVLLALFALVPVYARIADEPFYLTLFSRIMIYAIAATALNLLIGYTGLVSFGHALFIGIGAYAIGIPVFHEITNGWAHLGFAIVAAAVVATITGLIVLRTSGMAFIMITLAFAQMFYYLGVSLKQYGGDDGIALRTRSVLSPLDLESNVTLYYVIFAVLVGLMYFAWRLVHSRFGYVLRGIKSNERRMKALGFSTVRYKLAIYVLSGVVTAVAGLLLANLTSYASPAYAAWQVSGELIVMVVLGGMGTIAGSLVGATALLLFEEHLSSMTQHWMAVLGIAILLVVLVLRRGIYGSLYGWSQRRARERRSDAAAELAKDRTDAPGLSGGAPR